MAYNENLADRIRETLEHLPKLEEKKMFRGLTFMVDDKMCISVREEGIMCRIDPALHETLVEKNGCETMRMKNREYIGYVIVNEDVLKTKKQLDYWIDLALDFNKRAKVSPKKNK
jgi:TfoX/Sxy family transcriptional regulator of competence genes